MNPVCIWNRAFRWLFAITTFFLSASFMWNTHMQFQKLSPVSCSFKKIVNSFMSSFKKNGHFCLQWWWNHSSFCKKKHDYQLWIWTACKKTFFRVAKFWNSCRFFLANFFELFFLLKLFLKFAILNRFFM